ncbi:MAG: hypothetical protein JSS72_00330 [Armatimonadetes bacterium]|nr:hypothetical protein [Armatimonadota bacterium]
MARFALPILALLVFAFGFQSPRVEPVVSAQQNLSQLEIHESSASSSVVGQFRTNVTSWLWLHTDLYLHNGVEMRPLTEQEKKVGKGGDLASDSMKEEVRVTTIPARESDFRGVFGDVERETSAYKTMQHHSHNDPDVTLPLFRLMVLVDPHFTPGWINGAAMMALDHVPNANQVAVDFLKDGLRQNPGNVLLNLELGGMLVGKLRRFDEGISALQEGLKNVQPRDLADEEYGSAVEDGIRWLALAYRESGRPSEERQTLEAGLKWFPGDKVLSGMLDKLAK